VTPSVTAPRDTNLSDATATGLRTNTFYVFTIIHSSTCKQNRNKQKYDKWKSKESNGRSTL